MKKKTVKALKASIRKWKRKYREYKETRKINTGAYDCPLCALFIKKGKSDCKGCPIKKETGFPHCKGTPYIKVINIIDFLEDMSDLCVDKPIAEKKLKKAIGKEVKFLESLLPKKEKACKN